MATSEWDVYEELPSQKAKEDPWADFVDLPPDEDRSKLGPYTQDVSHADEPPPWARPLDFTPPAPGSGVTAPPIHSFTDADLTSLFGPRDEPPPRVSAPLTPEQEADIDSKMAALGEPSTGPRDFYNAMFRDQRLGPRLSEPGPRHPLPEITVSATRPKPVVDTRPPPDWTDLPGASAATIYDRYRLKGVGVQQMVAADDARKKYWQALILPDAYARAMDARKHPGPDGELPSDLWTNDPLIQDTAARLGMRADQFADVFATQDLMKMSPQELEAYKAEQQARIEPQAARREDLAQQGKQILSEISAERPNFTGDYSGKALVFDSLNSLIADMAPSLATGAVLGPEAGLATMGALVHPEFYATIKAQGGDDATAFFGSLAQTAAEIIPEKWSLEVLLKTPAGRQMMKNLLGRFAEGKTGHIASSVLAEGASEDLTELLDIGIDMGLFDQNVTLPQALDRLARSGLIGGLMGGGGAVFTGHLPEPELPANSLPDFQGPIDPELLSKQPTGPMDLAAALAGNVAPPDALPTAGTADFADIFANARPQGFAAPTLPEQSDVQQKLPMFGRPDSPRIGDLGTIGAPALTGSRDSEPAGEVRTAPTSPAAQGTATPEPLSSAIPQTEPAAAPVPPASQEPAPAPAPAAPAVSTAQEPPTSAAASPIVQAKDTRLVASIPAAVAALKDPKQHTVIETKKGPVRLVNVEDETGTGERVIHAFDETGLNLGSMYYSTKPGVQPHVAVHPEWQRQGIASAMYDLAEKTGGHIPAVNAEGQARLPEGQAFREGREAKRAASAPPPTAPPPAPAAKATKKAKGKAAKAAPVEAPAPAPAPLELPPPPPMRMKGASPSKRLAAQVDEHQQLVEKLWPEYQALKAKWEAARPYPAEKAADKIADELRYLKAAPTYAEYAKRMGSLADQLADTVETAREHISPTPKPLEPEGTYPNVTEEQPARQNVGDSQPPEDGGEVLPLETTQDKFEEVVNEFPALFESPKVTARPPVHPKNGPYISQEEAAKRIESWQQHALEQEKVPYNKNGNSNRVIFSLFDYTGAWAQPYADAGYDVRTFDLQNGADVRDFSVEWFMDHLPDISDVYGILIACPCTDFAVSGAKWWATKDADGRTEQSKELLFQALRTLEYWRPKWWALENPVGRIESLGGLPKARYSFQPHNFGDPYTKKTMLWGNFQTDLPTANVVPTEGSKMHSKYGGGSLRTKNMRSATPEGFAAAFFMANNYLDATPAVRMVQDYPDAAGAVEAALAAGFSEQQIRDVAGDPTEVHDDEGTEARKAIKNLVKTGKPEAAEPPKATTRTVQKPAAEPAPKAAPEGKRETVVTAAGTKIETQFEVMEAADLVTSDNPSFPQQYQPRERGSRIASQEQVAKIAGSIDPEQLGSNRHAEHGAPIIGKDDNLVESGNGRVMALRQMYQRYDDTAAKYRAFVAEQSGQDVSGMKAPILVRRRVTELNPQERAKFTKEANKTAVAKMSAGEQAKLDQEMLTPAVMAKLPEEMPEGFDLSKGEGAKFVEAFVSKFSAAERGELVDADGKPSSIAVNRAKAALLSKAYGGKPAGNAAIRRAVESTSSDSQSLVNTLVRFAAPFAQLREDIANGRVQEEADIGDQIAEAIEVVRHAGSPAAVTEWLNTEDMLDPKDETVKQLVQTFYNFDGRGNAKRLRTGGAIGATLGEYLNLARQHRPEQAGGGLFGDEGAAPILKPAAELGRLNEARRAKDTAREREETTQRTAQGGLFTAGGQPSAAVSSRARDAESGEDAQSAGFGAGRDASRAQTQEEGAQPDFLTDELRRPKRRKHTRRPGPFSMSREGTIRAAQNDQIWTDAGLDPDLMELAPPPERFKRAADLVQKRFGFRGITKANNLNWGEAIDAMKDAYVGLSNLAAVLNFNPEVMSLNGRIALSLEREHQGALAYYNPQTRTIGMTRRNDAFAHEWAHALDHYLVETFAPEMLAQQGRHLTGKTRTGGVAETMHDQVREAYIGVLNSMYFDSAKAAVYVADLEKKIATARTDKQRLKFQTQLDNFKLGHSKKGGIESEYYNAAKAMDARGPEGAGDEGYWQRPTEMFARAFEASIGHKLGGLPEQHPFVVQSRRMYNENRIGQMTVPYPQMADRTNIFNNLDTMMRALRDASYVNTGNAPAAIVPTDPRFWKKAAPSLPPKVAQQTRGALAKMAAPFRRQIAEAHRADREERQRDKQDQNLRNVKLNQSKLSGRRRMVANWGLTAVERIKALPQMLAHSIRGVLLSLEEKHAGNQGIAWLRSKFATDPGSGRFTGATWNEEVRHQEKARQNEFADVVKKHDIRGFDDAELRQLRDVLVNAIPENSVDPKIKHAAADMRRFLNDMYNYNVSNHVEIGYAKNGYLPRIIDSLIVENNVAGFRTAARELYSKVYPREVGSLGSIMRDPLEHPEGLQNLAQYVREIAKNGRVSDARDLAEQMLDDAKELEQALADLKKAAENDEDTTDLEERINELGPAIYDGLRDPWAMEAANDWEDRIRFGKEPEFAFDKRDVNSKYTKARVLPEETDAIMGDFLKNDPLELISTYISQSVRRVEFGKFFGNESDGKGKKLGWKLDAALHAANQPYRAADGSMQRVTADDMEELTKSIELLVGRYNTNMTKRALRWRMKLTALMTPVILARSLRSQLAEPWVTAQKTGSITDGLRVYYKQMQDVGAKLGIKGAKKQAEWRREMAEYFGIVADHTADQIMLQRYNLMDLNSSDRVKMSRFFNTIGVHPHAMSMRRATAEIFMTRYAPQMAARVLEGGKKGEQARGALAELGLDARNNDLIAELASLHNIKDAVQLGQLKHIDQIRTAINRFTDQAVQNPSAVDKPRLASMPEYSFMYGILSFQFAYQRNVLIATRKEIQRAWQQDWKMGAAATASSMAAMSLLGAANLAAYIAGQALFGRDDWDEMEKKLNQPQAGLPSWAWQTISRSGLFGAADPIVNAFLGLKYERDLTQLMAGPLPAVALKTVQDVGRAVVTDDKTNTLEHKAVESLWNGAVAPLITSTMLKVAGANPYADAALGTAMAFLTSPLVDKWVGDLFTGRTNKDLTDDAAEGDINAEQELQDRATEREQEDLLNEGETDSFGMN